MAEFEILKEENMRFVRVLLNNEMVRAEARALAYHKGNVKMAAKLPSIGSFLRASLSGEEPVRPTYTGVGELILESSLDGYYVLNVNEDWIVSSGAYWASEGGVGLGVHREKMITSFWSGEGLVEYKTKLSGAGKVALKVTGPVEEIELPAGEEMAVEGKLVVARTAGVNYSIRRAARSYLASYLSGESALSVYRGPGKILLCATPYWTTSLCGGSRAKSIGCAICRRFLQIARPFSAVIADFKLCKESGASNRLGVVGGDDAHRRTGRNPRDLS